MAKTKTFNFCKVHKNVGEMNNNSLKFETDSKVDCQVFKCLKNYGNN